MNRIIVSLVFLIIILILGDFFMWQVYRGNSALTNGLIQSQSGK